MGIAVPLGRVRQVRPVPAMCVMWTHPLRGEPCGPPPRRGSQAPSRGGGGTWLDCHPACPDCHRRLHQGHETFWRELGITREQANARTQMAWSEKTCAWE